MYQEYDKTSVQNIKTQFNEKQKEQIQGENQKLMKYIQTIREEKNKKSLWNKLFYK